MNKTKDSICSGGNKVKYGIVIGTNDNWLEFLLNIGEYVDVPEYSKKNIK